MATQATSRRPTRSGAKAGEDGWSYLALAIIILAAIWLVMQVAPYA